MKKLFLVVLFAAATAAAQPIVVGGSTTVINSTTVNSTTVNAGFVDAGFANITYANVGGMDAGMSRFGAGLNAQNDIVISGNASFSNTGAGAGAAAFQATNGLYRSGASSGNKAFEASSNGARWDFGAGTSDYASSDGTTVSFAGGVAVLGDMYACSGLGFSVAASTCNVTAGQVHSTNTKTVGSITLAAGTGTATTFSGAKCVCSNNASAIVGCQTSVSSTTLTVTSGAGTDTVSYICL